MDEIQVQLMAPRSSKNIEKSVPPATTPAESGPAFGAGDHSWTLQSIIQISTNIGELKTSIANLQASVDSTKSKVEDLVNWKHRILGGAMVIGAVMTVGGFFIGKFWDYFTIKAPSAAAQLQQPAQLPALTTAPIIVPAPAQGKMPTPTAPPRQP